MTVRQPAAGKEKRSCPDRAVIGPANDSDDARHTPTLDLLLPRRALAAPGLPQVLGRVERERAREASHRNRASHGGHSTAQRRAGRDGHDEAVLEYLPFLLLAMVAGVLVDRFPRRTVLVICGAGRSIIFMLVTAAYILGTLSIYHLYGAVLLLGTFSVASQVASQAYQRVLLARSQLMEGNTKREVSGSAASAAGPALAGALIEWIKAAPALLFDAAMSLISVAILLTIRTPEPPSSMSGGQGLRTLWGELVQGLRAPLGECHFGAVHGQQRAT